jgi:hypothetical protein
MRLKAVEIQPIATAVHALDPKLDRVIAKDPGDPFVRLALETGVRLE